MRDKREKMDWFRALNVPDEFIPLSTRAINCLMKRRRFNSKTEVVAAITEGRLHPDDYGSGGCCCMGWKTFDEICDLFQITRLPKNDDKARQLKRDGKNIFS